MKIQGKFIATPWYITRKSMARGADMGMHALAEGTGLTFAH